MTARKRERGREGDGGGSLEWASPFSLILVSLATALDGGFSFSTFNLLPFCFLTFLLFPLVCQPITLTFQQGLLYSIVIDRMLPSIIGYFIMFWLIREFYRSLHLLDSCWFRQATIHLLILRIRWAVVSIRKTAASETYVGAFEAPTLKNPHQPGHKPPCILQMVKINMPIQYENEKMFN